MVFFKVSAEYLVESNSANCWTYLRIMQQLFICSQLTSKYFLYLANFVCGVIYNRHNTGILADMQQGAKQHTVQCKVRFAQGEKGLACGGS